jgi:hypothetical protein
MHAEHAELVRNADECRETLTELRHRVETLTAERDQARRALLIMLAGTDISMLHRLADERGWDCFKGDADAR